RGRDNGRAGVTAAQGALVRRRGLVGVVDHLGRDGAEAPVRAAIGGFFHEAGHGHVIEHPADADTGDGIADLARTYLSVIAVSVVPAAADARRAHAVHLALHAGRAVCQGGVRGDTVDAGVLRARLAVVGQVRGVRRRGGQAALAHLGLAVA